MEMLLASQERTKTKKVKFAKKKTNRKRKTIPNDSSDESAMAMDALTDSSDEEEVSNKERKVQNHVAKLVRLGEADSDENSSDTE